MHKKKRAMYQCEYGNHPKPVGVFETLVYSPTIFRNTKTAKIGLHTELAVLEIALLTAGTWSCRDAARAMVIGE